MKKLLCAAVAAMLLTGSVAAMAETHTASQKGFGGDVTVAITVENGAIADVTVEGANETAGIGSRAVEMMPERIKEAGTWDVEAVSGATISSTAIKLAAKEAMTEAGLIEKKNVTVNMKAGTYTAKKNGFALCEPITVTTILSHNKIIDVKVDTVNISDTPPIVNAVVKTLVPRILESQSVKVDALTGATLTSEAVKAAVEDCILQALAAAECDPEAVSAFYTEPARIGGEVELNTQVLVVGMGGSGAMAAVSAQESGLSVLAIDKACRYGGTTGLTSECMAINPPRIKAEYNEGKDFTDADAMKAAWMAYTEGDAKEEMVDKIIYESGEALDWAHYENGFEYDYRPKTGFTAADVYAVKFQFLPNTVGANKAFIERYFDGVIADFTAAGGQYMLETEAYALITDETGAVKGVKAYNKITGTEYTIYADAVVLATGGFAGNPEMEEKYLSEEYYELKGDWKCYGLHSNDGKMIEAALEAGAGTFNIGIAPMVHNAGTTSFLAGYPTHVVEGQMGARTGRPLVWSEGDLPLDMTISANSLSVNKHGERFTNEEQVAMLNSWIAGPRFFSIWSSTQIDDIRDNGFKFTPQGPATIYLGYQGAIPQGIAIPNAYEVLEDAIAQGIAYKADTLEELAVLLGIDPATLVATVETYNAACVAGEDKEFGKKPEYLDAIAEGPYYAMCGAPYCYTTAGGLDIDVNYHVLKADHETKIDGLYAIGTDSMGVLYTEKKAYVTFGGAANGWALTSGYQVGRVLAEELAK
ncbi:MAG: FAD-dependent oxidoreductase [Clostridia bacterium]|nr:FAD-dependent oxidoreductase [Clostridia bacterium]